MKIPFDPQLKQVCHPHLIALVRALEVRVDTIEEENQKLRDEIERLKRPKANSQNLSQLPSRDLKPNAQSRKQNMKHEPPFGHERFVRKLVENPDRLIRVDINQGESCHHDLRGIKRSKVIRNQITELPNIEPVVPKKQRALKGSFLMAERML
jgi:hypothetical protein